MVVISWGSNIFVLVTVITSVTSITTNNNNNNYNNDNNEHDGDIKLLILDNFFATKCICVYTKSSWL